MAIEQSTTVNSHFRKFSFFGFFKHFGRSCFTVETVELINSTNDVVRTTDNDLYSSLLELIYTGVIKQVIFSLLFDFTSTHAFPDDCTDSCVSRMQMMLDTIPPTQNTSWNLHQRAFMNKTPFKPEGENVVSMQKFFSTVCQSYETVETCLEKCGSNSKQLLMVKQTYSGLKLICKDHRKDFFSALPCLTRYEPMAMSKCNEEIHQSHVTTANFTEAIMNREFYSIRIKFRFLCKDLSAMIQCMEPIVREGCGDRSTNLMLHFITLEFSSFEQLYSQLAFNEPLPHHCRSLLSLSHGRTSLFAQKSYVVNYPIESAQNSSPNWCPFNGLVVVLLLLSLSRSFDLFKQNVYNKKE